MHESVSDDRLARINPKMLNARPDKVTKKNAIHLNADKADIDQWIKDECYVASYSLGKPGDEVIAPPTVDKELALVILPSFRVVAVVNGDGERTDGNSVSRGGMSYTILK